MTQHLHKPSPFQMSKVTFKLGVRVTKDTSSESSEEDGVSCTSPEVEQCQMWTSEAAKTQEVPIFRRPVSWERKQAEDWEKHLCRALRTLYRASGWRWSWNDVWAKTCPRMCPTPVTACPAVQTSLHEPSPFKMSKVKLKVGVRVTKHTFSESSEEYGVSRTSP